MTTQNICNSIRDLIEYAIRKGLAEESDRVYLTNRIMGHQYHQHNYRSFAH